VTRKRYVEILAAYGATREEAEEAWDLMPFPDSVDESDARAHGRIHADATARRAEKP
jgi:hypothetical protein